MAVREVDLLLSRGFVAGKFCFVVATSTSEDRRLIERLFADLSEPGSDNEQRSVFTFLRSVAPAPAAWTVAGPRISAAASFDRLAAALTTLMAAVNISALDADPGALHLHAGAVTSRDGRTVLIAASRNSGKTTTVALLCARGWKFITDETVTLSLHAGDRRIVGFSKPISIKPGGLVLLPHLADVALPTDELIDDSDFRFAPMSSAGAEVADAGRPHVVVLLRRGGEPSTGEPAFRALHPADAVVALMQETLDADRYGPSAVADLVALSVASHCFEVTRGTPGATVELIERLANVDPVVELEVVQRPPSPRLAQAVDSYRIGDRSVVYHSTSGRILALDEAATRVWEHLAGWELDGEVEVNGPVVAPFVEQLRQLQLLEHESE